MMRIMITTLLLCLPVISSASNVAQIVVPVTLTYQGKSISTVMAVDTGATMTTIDTDLASRMRIPLEGDHGGLAQMANGEIVRYRTVVMDVAASTMIRDQIEVNIMDYAGAREGVHGMLGLNFLEGMTMTIDWKNKRIYWSE